MLPLDKEGPNDSKQQADRNQYPPVKPARASRAASSNHPPHRPKAKLFRIEFSDLQVSKEDPVIPRCDQFESQLFEAKDFADEDPVLVPTDIAGVVYSS
jgi:hypothetical protein